MNMKLRIVKTKKNNCNKKFSKCFIIVLICVIMSLITLILVYASNLSYSFKEVHLSGRNIRMMPDSTAFHWYISEYNAIDKTTYPMSLTGPLIESVDVDKKMQGYGKYHMQMQYNLGNFIAYCHGRPGYATVVETLCQWGDQDKEFPASLNYDSLTTKLSGQASYITPFVTTLNTFWNTMCTGLGSAFETLQDDFIVDRYLRPASDIMRLNNKEYEEIFGIEGSYSLSLDAIDNLDGDEFMTALLSAVYSDFYTADLSNVSSSGISIGRANLIPFLYNVDETGVVGREIARYAYIAYIEGFLTAGRTDGFHYWEQEYESVFNESYNDSDYDIEALRVKFDRALDVLSEDQGKKGNRLLGATITEVIRSPYNVSTQLAQTKNIINDILGDIGVDSSYKDLIAKNYLMVKHMMDNSHIDRTIKDYCQGVVFNESKFSQGQFDEKNSSTALLADFQLVECNKGWRDDTDKDGLSDKEELGEQVKYDITAFVEKKLNTGEDLWTKANAWKEFNDMLVVEGSSADCKVYAKMYDYKSNPVLRDTDFDGIEDGNGWGIFGIPLNMRVDEDPKNNNFKGSSMTTSDGDLSLDYNSDFRYMLWDENLYNDELSQMSLIMSNLAANETITLKEKRKNYGTMNVRSYMERLGFTGIDTEELSYETDIKVKYYIGYKSMDYYSKKRGIIGIFLSTNESIEAYKKLAVDLDYLRDNNLYNQIARDIYNKISTDKIHALETEYGLDYCYWLSGKGIAGGIASEVATVIRKEDNDFKRNNNWYTIKDIYCYTFGAPKTHVGANYTNNFIKNIINEDDYLTKVIPDDLGYRYGFTYNASIYSDFIYNYKNLGRTPKYTGNYMQMNSVNNALNELRNNHSGVMDEVNDDMSKLLSKHISGTSNEDDMSWSRNYVNTSDLATEIINQVRNNELKTASSVKAYWILAKVLEGIDEKTKNQRSYNKTIETANSESWSYKMNPIIEVIVELADWYVNRIPTYQHRYANYNNETGRITRNQYTNATQDARDYFNNNGGSIIERHDGPGIIKNEQGEVVDSFAYDYLYPSIIRDNSGDNAILEISANRIGYRHNELVGYANNRNDEVGHSQYAGYGGDDCNSFAMGVIRLDKEGDRGQTANGSNRLDSTGMQLQNTSADMMRTDDNFEAAMMNLGFDKYAYRDGRWVKFVNNNGTIIQRPLTEALGNNFTMSVDFLEPGDMLVKGGHVEFYLGYINAHKIATPDINEFIKVSELNTSYIEYDSYFDDDGNDLRVNRVYSTFGWGRVHNQSPERLNYFRYNNNSFSLGSDGGYNVIFRKNK